MTVRELSDRLLELQERGHGDNEVFTLTTLCMLRPVQGVSVNSNTAEVLLMLGKIRP